MNVAYGEGEHRIDRRLKKGQVNAERLAQMFGVSHKYSNICIRFDRVLISCLPDCGDIKLEVRL